MNDHTNPRRNDELIAHCPYANCGKVIFRDMIIEGKVENRLVLSYRTRCPHCGKDVRITVGATAKADPVY